MKPALSSHNSLQIDQKKLKDFYLRQIAAESLA